MADFNTEALFTQALKKRAELSADSETNAFRLIDDEGDQFFGITVDQYADVWLVSTKDDFLHPIFKEPRDNVRTLYWKRLDQDNKQPPAWVWGERVEDVFLIRENGMAFEISMQAGYSQGIFLDQRENRARVRARVEPRQRVLNTFSYTSAFSVAAACGQAITTSLDLSNPYLAWGKRNLQANGIDPSEHYFCKGDAMGWMKRFAKQGRKFAGVILDPPTFSRSDGGVFRTQKDYDHLVEAAAAITESNGWILATCNDRGMEHGQFEELVRNGIQKGRRSIADLKHTFMPPDFTGEDYLKSIWIDL
ncbi:MAG: 23S rRNA (cytosine1962-C5)-methyltransferase [Verrucomicrobiales bacterium]|jgi:23S rRNA (cytosine1962-C5)-methyltransferase